MSREGLSALAWLGAVIAIALGAAGIVAGMDAPSIDGSDRSGRTARGDTQVIAALDPIETDLRALSDVIGDLGIQARGVLAALSGNDTAPAEEAITTGTDLVADIDARAARIGAALARVPIVGTDAAAYELSPAVRDRHGRIFDGLDATRGIDSAWTRLTVGSLSAIRLSGLLAAHDEAVVEAAERGRAADYPTALVALDDADDAIAQSRIMRNQLAATVEVTTLDAWLDRSEAYDEALRALYLAVRDSGGRATDDVQAAARAEEAARARLPPDTRALVLIMSDIGRGGMSAAAIAIEQARGDLDEALVAPSVPAAP